MPECSRLPIWRKSIHRRSTFDADCPALRAVRSRVCDWRCVRRLSDCETSKVLFRCRKCEHPPFPSNTQFMNHLESAHPEVKAWKCNECEFKCERAHSHTYDGFLYMRSKIELSPIVCARACARACVRACVPACMYLWVFFT